MYDLDEVVADTAGRVIALTGSAGAPCSRPANTAGSSRPNGGCGSWWRGSAATGAVELTLMGLPGDTERLDAPAEVAARAGVGTIASTAAHYATPDRFPLAAGLAAVRARRSLDDLDSWLPAAPTAYLRGAAEMTEAFARCSRAWGFVAHESGTPHVGPPTAKEMTQGGRALERSRCRVAIVSAVKKTAPGGSDSSGPKPQYPIESVDNALKILLLFGERSEVRLTEISEYLGVASSTAHRMLAMLLYRGFVRQDPGTKVYRPGTSLTGVAYSILQRFDFRKELHPFLERLNTDLRETVHLGLLDGTMVRFIDAIESPQGVRVASRLGMSMPASSTSTGKAMLAQMSKAEVDALFPSDELDGLTEKSLRTRAELDQQLQLIRKRGYAVSSEESERGVSSVAVAFAPSRAPARLAFNVSLPTSRMSEQDQAHIGSALLSAVEYATAVLHG